jgi:hypothetical protein
LGAQYSPEPVLTQLWSARQSASDAHGLAQNVALVPDHWKHAHGTGLVGHAWVAHG